MKTFPLRIGTPDGIVFEGEAERVICRAITGDLAVLAGHINMVTALGMGVAQVVTADGTRRKAACIGGMLSVMNGVCRVMATTWEWTEDIDQERAKAARERAETKLSQGGLTDREYAAAQARLRRAMVRLSAK